MTCAKRFKIQKKVRTLYMTYGCVVSFVDHLPLLLFQFVTPQMHSFSPT